VSLCLPAEIQARRGTACVSGEGRESESSCLGCGESDGEQKEEEQSEHGCHADDMDPGSGQEDESREDLKEQGVKEDALTAESAQQKYIHLVAPDEAHDQYGAPR
jgi:hypothetical protein